MASFTVPCPKTFALLRLGSTARDSDRRGSSPRPSVLFGSSLGEPRQSRVWKVCAQLNQVTAEKSSNSSPVLSTKPGVASPEAKDESADLYSTLDASSISEFMSQVSDLIKLVDSRDISELQVKQLDCEILIRKQGALPPAAPVASMPPHLTHAMLPSPPPPAPTASASPPPAPVSTSPAPAKASTSSHPPLKCPMAGTFYRCPGPGEPPFVKVGDKVQKGQVICIIEAMKLMNEIEADQSGTVAEILLDDGKPVSIDTPLFVIVP
ncbi:biotin carboxyl carrier protein of acetyl-CoA carboxylase 2, chloroplastic-like [Corylus avellana]|uniref:biotin carboxyl carrier protein of acetyl-CoA carboxylase 2, chloroplastic-like n=1 Tax=Corylus avellana TaxID=13451 RepID=UPI001E23179F|nr:biotin carboxyl carrier protein of acetyl-CoA carboxylase 2, chloroplastic-like [Corylus avellana]